MTEYFKIPYENLDQVHSENLRDNFKHALQSLVDHGNFSAEDVANFAVFEVLPKVTEHPYIGIKMTFEDFLKAANSKIEEA